MTATQPQSKPLSPGLLWGAIVAALVGAGLSVYLTWVHLLVKSGETVGGLCNLSTKVNCNVAAGSVYSEVAGVPVAVIGFGFYAATIAVLLVGRGQVGPLVGRLLVTLYGAACIYSLFLAGISAFVLGSFCWACSSLYVVNIAILLMARFLSGEGYVLSLKRLVTQRADLGRSPLPAAFVLTFIAAVLAAHFGAQAAAGAAGPTPEERRSEAQLWARQEFAAQVPVAPELWEQMKKGPAKGEADACVTLVEFSDFQCPFCSRVVPDVEKLQAAFPKDVRVVFRHNPLDHQCNPRVAKPFHQFACGAAFAAVCAEDQGKFWPMHDRLFEGQAKLRQDDLLGYAKELGLGVNELSTCMASPGAKARVAADLALGGEIGIRGTPALFLNGRKIPGGAVGYDRLAAAVEGELAGCKETRN